MIRIALCDDEPIFLDELGKRVSDGFEHPNDVRIDKFTSGEELLRSHGEEPYDAVFPDIDMPYPDGFSLAERIDTLIVFVTNHDELVYSSLRFRPFRFVRKSRLDEELPEVLTAVRKELQRQSAGRRIAFGTINGEILLDVSEIVYIEIFGHKLNVRTIGGACVECSGSLSELEKRLECFDFVRTHKSYLVNCKYMYSIGARQVILDDKTVIPLSRYKADKVRERFKKSFGSAV